ncbi:BPSS1780 family membrane protein [Tepidiphilus olei]|uniref:BPSS1780 family membrane protein n=1 Tax=Tepidiphilus olei TaxID=2502184 RepID=UPI00115D8E10|nr:BPSS1780 family membrane protein [Tepidiphilus olei]
MHAHILGYSHGWRWITEGFALWRRAPALTSYVSFAYVLLLLLASSLPYLGQFLAALLMPILSIGVLEGMAAAEGGRRPGPEVLFTGFRGPWRSLAALGAFQLAGNLLAVLATILVDGGLMLGLYRGTIDPASLESEPQLLWPLLVWLAIALPVTMAYWFAPALVAWHRQPWPKALFFSFYATLRNWRALLVYALGIAAVVFALVLVLSFLAALIHPYVLGIALFLLPLVLVPTLFAGLYLQVRDVFGPR